MAYFFCDVLGDVNTVELVDDGLKVTSVKCVPQPDGEVVDGSLQRQHHWHPLVVGMDYPLSLLAPPVWQWPSDGAHARVRRDLPWGGELGSSCIR